VILQNLRTGEYKDAVMIGASEVPHLQTPATNFVVEKLSHNTILNTSLLIQLAAKALNE